MPANDGVMSRQAGSGRRRPPCAHAPQGADVSAGEDADVSGDRSDPTTATEVSAVIGVDVRGRSGSGRGGATPPSRPRTGDSSPPRLRLGAAGAAVDSVDDGRNRKDIWGRAFEVHQLRDELVGSVGDDLWLRAAADAQPADDQDTIGALTLDTQRPLEVTVPPDQDAASAAVSKLPVRWSGR